MEKKKPQSDTASSSAQTKLRSDLKSIKRVLKSCSLTDEPTEGRKNNNSRDDDRLQSNRDKVLGNSLVVELICSFTDSKHDIRNFRLVNRLFQHEASNRYRVLQKKINLSTDADIKELTGWAKRRKKLKLTPFPLSSFQIYLDLDLKLMEKFAATVGPHVDCYSIQTTRPRAPWPFHKCVSCSERGRKVASLLAHSPQLKELELMKSNELEFSKEELNRIPTSFPRLERISMKGADASTGEISFGELLLNMIVGRAVNLKRLGVNPYEQARTLRLLNYFVKRRPNNLPLFSISTGLNVRPKETFFLKKLMAMKLEFESVTLTINASRSSGDEEEEENEVAEDADEEDDKDLQSTMKTVSTWLESQTKSLKALVFEVQVHPETHLFQFPGLLALKGLRMDFPTASSRTPESNLTNIQPLVGNPFPSLSNLILNRYKEDYGLFVSCSMSSVLQVQLCAQRSAITDLSWRLAFPNLISLQIQVFYGNEKFFYSTLQFILTHLTQLIHLKLELTSDWPLRFHFAPDKESNCDYWDILTGGAPRTSSNFGLSERKMVLDTRVEEEPVNGIYQVPSLRNMKGIGNRGIQEASITGSYGCGPSWLMPQSAMMPFLEDKMRQSTTAMEESYWCIHLDTFILSSKIEYQRYIFISAKFNQPFYSFPVPSCSKFSWTFKIKYIQLKLTNRTVLLRTATKLTIPEATTQCTIFGSRVLWLKEVSVVL